MGYLRTDKRTHRVQENDPESQQDSNGVAGKKVSSSLMKILSEAQVRLGASKKSVRSRSKHKLKFTSKSLTDKGTPSVTSNSQDIRKFCTNIASQMDKFTLKGTVNRSGTE